MGIDQLHVPLGENLISSIPDHSFKEKINY